VASEVSASKTKKNGTRLSIPNHRACLAFVVVSLLVVICAWPLWLAAQDHRRWVASVGHLEAEVIGHDFRLYVRYPGRDQQLHTDDDRFGTRDLYVPGGSNVRLHLSSLDFIYLIEIPAVDVYEVAAPDLQFDVAFVAPVNGNHELLGSQMCGYDHASLLGKIRVQSADQFVRTMKDLSNVAPQFTAQQPATDQQPLTDQPLSDED
jgi:heme/copper-type cytochrome/quinol oxidase subunit 2